MYHFLEIKIAQFGVDIFGQLVQGVSRVRLIS